MPLETCPFLKTAYFQSLFSMWLWFKPNEEGREGGERELIYCPPCFCRVCGRDRIWNPESGIRNSQPFSFCYSWKTISHLQYLFVSLFLKLQNIKQDRSLRSLLSLLQALGGFPIQTVAAVERCLNLNILLLKRSYLKLINYDSRTAEQCKCEVSITSF